MYCDNCDNDNDVLKVSINDEIEDEENKQIKQYSYDDIGNKQKIWIKDSIRLINYKLSNIDVRLN